MRSLRVLAVAVLAVVLALSAAQNVLASMELAYDDGSRDLWGGQSNGDADAVRFSLPSGVSSARLLTARYYVGMASTSFTVRIYDSDRVTDLTPSFAATSNANPAWVDVDLTAKNIIVTRDFYIAIQWIGSSSPSLGLDTTTPPPISGRCWTIVGGGWGNDVIHNCMIRAVIDPIVPTAAGPVGGFMEPVNKLAVFAPYLALFGVIGAVAVIYWKRPDN